MEAPSCPVSVCSTGWADRQLEDSSGRPGPQATSTRKPGLHPYLQLPCFEHASQKCGSDHRGREHTQPKTAGREGRPAGSVLPPRSPRPCPRALYPSRVLTSQSRKASAEQRWPGPISCVQGRAGETEAKPQKPAMWVLNSNPGSSCVHAS